MFAAALPAPPDTAATTPAATQPQTAEAPQRPAVDLLSLIDAEFQLGPWALHGYAQMDAADYDQHRPGPLDQDFRRGATGSMDADRARELQDGFILRRVRIGGDGTLGSNIAYRAVFEFGGSGQRGNPRVAEVWIAYDKYSPWLLQAGAFPQPANMEDSTSASANMFLERATAADLARSLGAGEGRIGITLKHADARWFGALSLTGPVLDNGDDYAPRAAVVARFSRMVRLANETELHLGASASYVATPAHRRSQETPTGFPVRLRNEPEVRVDNMPLIDTGDITASHARVLGLEFAAQRRNLHLQAEGFRFDIERREGSGVGNPHFSGFYVEGGWVITGESRRFDTGRAAFWLPKLRRPVDEGGWGVWELALRYSRMNLNYNPGAAGQAPPLGGVRGGDQKILSTALEWYPRPRFRVLLNVMRVSVDRLNPASALDPEPFGPPPATPPIGVQIGQTMNLVAARLRYAF